MCSNVSGCGLVCLVSLLGWCCQISAPAITWPMPIPISILSFKLPQCVRVQLSFTNSSCIVVCVPCLPFLLRTLQFPVASCDQLLVSCIFFRCAAFVQSPDCEFTLACVLRRWAISVLLYCTSHLCCPRRPCCTVALHSAAVCCRLLSFATFAFRSPSQSEKIGYCH